MTMNPITQLRQQRAKSKRASLMPVSQKPRKKYKDRDLAGRGPNLFTAAGKLLYGFYDAATTRLRQYTQSTVDCMVRAEDRAEKLKPKLRTRLMPVGYRTRRNPYGGQRQGPAYAAPCDAAGSRPAERRRRQQAHLHQHPSVIARFAGQPTAADIAAAEAGAA